MTRVRELCFQVLGHLARVEEVKQVVKLTGVNSSQVEERVRVTPSKLPHAKHPLKESAAKDFGFPSAHSHSSQKTAWTSNSSQLSSLCIGFA